MLYHSNRDRIRQRFPKVSTIRISLPLHEMDGKLDGKVVIDATNPLKWIQGSALERTIPQNVIAGRVMAQRLPTAHIVKAFTYAPLLESEAHRQGKRLAIAMAGDDETAKNTVAELIKDAGYVPVRYRNVRRVSTARPWWRSLEQCYYGN